LVSDVFRGGTTGGEETRTPELHAPSEKQVFDKSTKHSAAAWKHVFSGASAKTKIKERWKESAIDIVQSRNQSNATTFILEYQHPQHYGIKKKREAFKNLNSSLH